MRKAMIFIPILLLVVLVLVGAGCGGEEAEESVTEEEKVGEEAESLTDILAKAKDVASFKYDTAVTAPGQAAITTKVWYKGTKMRVEGTFEGYTSVYLLDTGNQLAYLYVPAQNMAMKMDWSQAKGTAGESPTEQSGSVMDYNPVTVGTEVLDGKTCLVVEYTTETENVKMWIWTRHGIPIRTEIATDQGTTVVEIKNIDFGDILDSVFELPAGVQIMEIPSF